MSWKEREIWPPDDPDYWIIPAVQVPGVINIVGADCNENGLHDEYDVWAGTSPDVNANGLPDECEDCQPNGVLDDRDIVDGTSDDCQPNEIPDECERDCNDNDVPDDCDIADGTSLDLNADGIPDECRAIPTVSQWGLAILALSLLAAAKIRFRGPCKASR